MSVKLWLKSCPDSWVRAIPRGNYFPSARFLEEAAVPTRGSGRFLEETILAVPTRGSGRFPEETISAVPSRGSGRFLEETIFRLRDS